MPSMKCRHRRRLVGQSLASTRPAQPGHAVLSVSFDASGRFVIAACGKDLRLWSATTGILIQSYPDPTGRQVSCVVPTRNGESLASCAEKIVVLWDVATAQVVRRLSCLQRANCVAFLGEHVLAVGTYDQQVRLYDLRQTKQSPVQVLEGAKDSVSDVIWSQDDYLLVAASIDGAVRSYDVRQGIVNVDDFGGCPVSSVCFTNDNECILASCLDEKLRLILKESGEVLNEYSGHKNTDFRVDCGVLFDDSVVYCGSEDGFLCAWDLAEEGGDVYRFRVNEDAGPVCALASHPSESFLVVGGHDGGVNLYEIH
jgi:mitogen-activated protein kinase organizer 1